MPPKKNPSIPATTTLIEEGAFRRTICLEGIEVDNNNPNYLDVNGVLYNTDKTVILCYPAAKQTTNYTLLPTVKRIGVGAFSNAQLDTITPSDNLQAIGGGAFEFSELRSYHITQHVETIEKSVFYRTPYIATITVNSNNKSTS